MKRPSLFAALLAVQAVLLLARLDWLPVWGDEAFSLQAARMSWSQMGALLRGDVHPPLYFALLKLWLAFPWPSGDLVPARLLSALTMLGATVLFDRLWLRGIDGTRRASVLALWTLSACGFLYARMARSYSLQVLLFVVAARLALDAVEQGGWKRWTAAWAACWALLMTHYVPGFALLAALHLLRWRLWWFDLAMLTAVAPWLAPALEALQRWSLSGATRGYSLTGHVLGEQVLKAGYAFVSFAAGETFPVLALAGALAALALTAQSLRTADRNRATLLFVGAGLVGYIAVVRWVSIPFVPARLLWLLPFVFLAWSRGSRALLALVVGANLLSIAGYWRLEGFLNQAYVVPWDAIARTIDSGTRAGTIVLYDGFNSDGRILRQALGRDWRVEEIRAGLTIDPAARQVWVFRSTHDISPHELVTQTEALWCDGKTRVARGYGRYPPWLHRLLGWTGSARSPDFAYLLIRCSAP